MADFVAKIMADLDDSKFSSQIKELQNKYKGSKIDIQLNIASEGKKLQDLGKQAGKQLSQGINGSAAKDVKNITSEYSTLMSVIKDISKYNVQLAKVDPKNTNEIQTLNKLLSEAEERLVGLMAQMKTPVDFSEYSTFSETVRKLAANEELAASKTADFKKKLADKAAVQQTTAEFKELKQVYQDIASKTIKLRTFENTDSLTGSSSIAQINQLKIEIDELTEKRRSLEAVLESKISFEQFNELKAIVDSTNQKLGELDAAVIDTKNKLAKDIDIKLDNGTFDSQVATLSARLRSLGIASEATEAEIEELRAAIKNMARTDIEVDERIAAFNRYQETLQKCTNNIKTMQQDQKGYKKSFSSIVSSLVQFASTYIGVQEVFNALQKGVQTVVELDYALIDLQKTTAMTRAELNSFYYEANDVAKEMGVTTQEIIDQASAWSRLGYSSKEAATEMAKLSSMFATISPGMSVDTATDGLVSVMKAYGYEVDDVLDGIMSKINVVGNTAATSNDQIIVGLQKSASAMAVMGSTLDENVALFTAAQEIVQDESSVGNGIKSVAMRVRGYDEETGELSEDLANITGEVINLTKVASNGGKGVSLFTDETQTEYKSIYKYLGEIADIYDEIDAKSQQELLDLLFGKNRANVCPYAQKCA